MSPRRIALPLLLVTLVTLGGCVHPRRIVVPQAAYDAAFDKALARAKKLGYVPTAVKKDKGVFETEKGCGCTDLVVTFKRQPAGEYAVTLTGGALWSTFHHEARKVEDAILEAGGQDVARR
jgi:hypothetical protein